MGFYDDEENVETYVQMAEGYDGRELVTALRQHLPPGSTVLGIGHGAGKGSGPACWKSSLRPVPTGRKYFWRRYRRDHPGTDVLLLDAVTLDTEQRFDSHLFQQSACITCV